MNQRGINSATTLAAAAVLAALALAAAVGCGPSDSPRVIKLWHQMRPEDRAVLDELLVDYQAAHKDVVVRALYKETEELRSGLVSATLAEQGPEIIYGASDVVGLYQAMGALADMAESPKLPDGFTKAQLDKFDDRAIVSLPERGNPQNSQLVFVGDRFGNHLALVYHKSRFVEDETDSGKPPKKVPWITNPPKTTAELLKLAIDNTVDENGDGAPDRYGLVWNYTEPFFVIPFLTGYGAWVFKEPTDPAQPAIPTLNTPEAVAAYRFVASLRSEHNVLPRSADYEAAAELFRSGKAAMIIDGDWSWQGYLSTPGIDVAVAVLPTVDSTGKPMAPMVAPKGYSLSAFAHGQAAVDAMELIKFLTGEYAQRKFLSDQGILPSRVALRDDPLVSEDDVMSTSIAQADVGRAMPVAVEMRAVWDAMRPPYQLMMAGQIDPAEAARRMQVDAERKAAALTTPVAADGTAPLVYAAGLAAVLGAALWQRRSVIEFFHDLRRNPLAYALVLPSIVLILLTVLYPLVYNVVLSFSNMSLTNLRDWQIIGVGNYASLATGDQAAEFWRVFQKTIFWTVVNVFFHVTIGVLLAVTLNGPVRGKSIYRVLLIIPWAVPAYITALTWRGMFDEQFGAVNQAIRSLGWLNAWLPSALQLEPVNWLGQANPAFAACIIANVWLGFPFMMVIALGGLQGIPAELYEAARIDRASRWQQFRQITLPMLKPVLLPAITLGAVWTFNNLNIVWLVSNTGEPADQTHILVSYVYKAVFNMYQYGYGAALSMVIFGILLVFSMLFLTKTKATEAVY